jgi:two-component system LytT family sensor kinase
MNKKRLRNILVHLGIWVAFIMMNYYISLFQKLPNVLLGEYFAKYLLVVPVFYLNAYLILPQLLGKKKYIYFLLAEAGLAFGHYFAFQFVYTTVLPAVLDHYPKLTFQFALYFPRTFWWYITFSLYGFGFWYARQSIEKQKKIRELERQNFISETNFLKSQINPHFLHNSLNTLFSQAIPLSQELADNILRLANMMRYSLESINKADGKVYLQDEIQYMKDLIDINQLRYLNKLHIDYEEKGAIDKQTVPALSLITAVENAFKYGNIKDKDSPLEISIDVVDNRVHFVCRNKVKAAEHIQSSGTGIENLRKRLEFQYPGKYSLDTKHEAEYFTFDLIIYN